MSEIVKPIILDETGQAIAEAIGRISRHAESADTATTAENAQKLGNKLPSEYADAEHTHTKSDITDFPASLPASDVPTWAKQPTKPTYTASEVGALPASAKATDSDLLDGNDSTYFATASSLSQNGYGTESGGSNIWDEKWEKGMYDSNGNKTSSDAVMRNASPIKVKSGGTYFHTCSKPIYYLAYDSSMNCVLTQTEWSVGESIILGGNVAYINFRTNTPYGAVYLNDIAIIEGTSGSYSPYFASNKSLTDRIDRDYELERFGYVCPIINGVKNFVDSDGVMHRKIARVDLGGLTWTYESSNSRFRASVASLGVGGEKYATNFYKNATVSGYANSNSTTNKTFFILATNNNVYFYDSAYTTVESFTSAMKSVYLYYELSTEETYSAYDTPSVQSMISDEWVDDGTQYLQDEYRIYENVLYKCLNNNRNMNPSRHPEYWQKCKVTDVVGSGGASAWTSVGTTVGSGTIALPSTFTEVYAEIAIKDNSTIILNITIPKSALSSTEKRYRLGSITESASFVGGIVGITTSAAYLYLAADKYGDCTSTSRITVYAR